MFARDEEGRIGMAAGFELSVTRPVVLGISLLFCPPGAGLGPHPCSAAGKHIGTECCQATALRKASLDRKRNERKASGA